MAILQKCKGAECPECGCLDAERRGQSVRWGQIWPRWTCQNCGKRFSSAPEAPPEPAPEPPPGLTYHVLRCPGCGSGRTIITRTMRPTRYHKCKDCGHNFKSVEAESRISATRK